MVDKYFESYEDLETHRIMLKDKERCNAYFLAITSNKDVFKDKIVMDLGAGTGILSCFCIMAGAKKVYAVEASLGMIPILQATIEVNNFEDKIEVIPTPVEDVILDQKVDIIVSEWMGFTLLHEGMLSSVLTARDKFLKSDGVLVPDWCELFVSLCHVPSLFGAYNNIDGIDMSHFGRTWRTELEGKAEIYQLKNDKIISEPCSVFKFNILKLTQNDLKIIKKTINLIVDSSGQCDALCFWFQVSILNQILSTHPYKPETHWKQTLITFPDKVDVEKGNKISFDLTMTQNNMRRYVMDVENIEWSK